MCCTRGIERRVVVPNQVGREDHQTFEVIERDQQLAAHAVDGLFGSLGDVGQALREQGIGFIDEKDGVGCFRGAKELGDVLGAFPVIHALNIRITGADDLSARGGSDQMRGKSLPSPRRAVEVQSAPWMGLDLT